MIRPAFLFATPRLDLPWPGLDVPHTLLTTAIATGALRLGVVVHIFRERARMLWRFRLAPLTLRVVHTPFARVHAVLTFTKGHSLPLFARSPGRGRLTPIDPLAQTQARVDPALSCYQADDAWTP